MLPWICADDLLCELTLIIPELDQTRYGIVFPLIFPEFLEKPFIELKSRFLTSEKRKTRLMSGIGTHIVPILSTDIWEIGEDEGLHFCLTWYVGE